MWVDATILLLLISFKSDTFVIMVALLLLFLNSMQAVDFKKPVYKEALAVFAPYLQ